MATKLSPRPEKISCTRPWVRSTPAKSDQSMPPRAAAPSPSAMSRPCGNPPVGSAARSTPWAKIAPRVIWPSTPMFQRLAAKVTQRAAPHRKRGVKAASVRKIAASDPSPPCAMTARVAKGGAPVATTMTSVTPSAAARA